MREGQLSYVSVFLEDAQLAKVPYLSLCYMVQPQSIVPNGRIFKCITIKRDYFVSMLRILSAFEQAHTILLLIAYA